MTNGDRSLEQWGDIYARQRPAIVAFVEKLEALFDELLDDYAWMYTWADQRGTFVDRLFRARRASVAFENPLKELLGFAGLGVVVIDLDRASDAADTVERELDVNRDVSAIPGEPGSHQPFRQYFVSIPSTWAALSEWRPYAGLWVNIDVQTLQQYAWDRVDADLPYYWHSSYPPEVQQQIAEYTSLAAAADEKLEKIWETMKRMRLEYELHMTQNALDVELNADSLGEYLTSSETVAELVRLGIAAGLEENEDYRPGRLSLEQTVWLLRRNRVGTLQELDDFLQSSMSRAGDVLSELARLSTEAGLTPDALSESIVEWLVLVLRRADVETVSLVRFWSEIEDALNTLIGNPLRPREDS